MKQLLLASLILSILLGVFFFDVLFKDKTYQSPDAQAAVSVSIGMKDISFPQHCPYIFSGMPATLVYNEPILYFPNILHLSKYWSHIAHLLLAGIGMFLILRNYGFFPAMTGAISFMFCTNMIGQEIFGHAGLMMTAAYIPLIFWLLRRFFIDRSHWGWLALVMGLQMQRGHYQIVLYAWLLITFVFAYQFFQKNGSPKKFVLKKLRWVGVCVLLSFGMAAMTFLPRFEYAEYSIRSSIDIGYATSWSLHPKEIITFVMPYFYGFGDTAYTGYFTFTHFPQYLGIVTVILACFARGRIVFLHLSIIGVSLLIAMGKYTPIYGILYDYLPLFDNFRVPSMILILVQFSTAILAGMGMNRIQEKLK